MIIFFYLSTSWSFIDHISNLPIKQNRYACDMQTEKKPLKERYFTRPYCGTYQDRDVNASINILRLGLEQAMDNNWTSALKPLP